MDQPIIKVENLSKRYKLGVDRRYQTFQDTIINAIKYPFSVFKRKDTKDSYIWALKNVSFDIKEGEVVGIIGRNGAGKSTLLKVLSRITEPTEGRVIMRGRVSSLLEVGTGFHPELTGRENIFLNGAVLGMKNQEIKDKFDDIVDFAGIERFLDTPAKRYSSGMYVRLAFSVAAHLDPEILLVDEVLSVGDAEFQKKCLGKMQDVASSGRTVLFVSHNMNAVQKLCKRSILINDGKIQNIGETQDIIDEYLSFMDRFSTETPLAERKDRQGDGSLRFINVTFENYAGEKLGGLSSGEDTRIILDYVCTDKILTNVLVSLEIIHNGERFVHFDTYLTDQNFKEIPLKGQIICNIPKLPLLPGNYSLSIYSTANMIETDWINEALYFTVNSGRYFRTGSLPANHAARILVDHSWDLRKKI